MISAFKNLSYSSAEIFSFLKSFLIFRTSAVCGKLPIVVVASLGYLNLSCCFSTLSAKGILFSNLKLETLAWTLGSLIFLDSFLFLFANTFASSSFCSTSFNSSPANNFEITFTSSSFSREYANQDLISSSIFSSYFKVYGTWSNEDEVPIRIFSFGIIAEISFKRLSDSWISLIQIFRPLIIPTSSFLLKSRISSSDSIFFLPWTKSKANPIIGVRTKTFVASTEWSKYVATTILTFFRILASFVYAIFNSESSFPETSVDKIGSSNWMITLSGFNLLNSLINWT